MENHISEIVECRKAMEKIMEINGELDPLYKQLKTTYDKVDTLDLDADYISELKYTLFSIILRVYQFHILLEKLGEMIGKFNEKDTDIPHLLDILKQMSDELEGLIPETYDFLESIHEL